MSGRGTGSREKLDAALVGRCDSFVVETDVHYPTDVSLLRDSVRGLIREASRSCGDFRIDGWHQRQHWEDKVGDLFKGVRRTDSRRPSGAVQSYLKVCLKLTDSGACAKTLKNRCGRGNVGSSSRTGLVPPQKCASEDTRQASHP